MFKCSQELFHNTGGWRFLKSRDFFLSTREYCVVSNHESSLFLETANVMLSKSTKSCLNYTQTFARQELLHARDGRLPLHIPRCNISEARGKALPMYYLTPAVSHATSKWVGPPFAPASMSTKYGRVIVSPSAQVCHLQPLACF